VLLLDEPLSALDANLREEVRVEIKMIQKTLGLTTILVTHDQQEALAMSDEVVVMRQGSVQQTGDPRTVYQFPRNRFVASFLGHANGCRGVLVEPTGGSEWLVRLEGGIALRGTPGGPPGELVQLSRGEAVDVVIRGSELLVSAFEGQCEDGANSFTGVIADASFLGDDAHYVIDAGGTRLTAVCRIAGAGTEGHGATIPAGTRVRVDVPPRACVILPIA
jgi:ABC-type Fe3+/spermidine/putrescine transport system ATPase subunit